MSDDKAVDTRVELTPEITKFLTNVFKSQVIEYSLKMKIRIGLDPNENSVSYDVLSEAHDFYSKFQKKLSSPEYTELRDLVKTSRVFNRNLPEPIRSPELVKRLTRLKKEQEQVVYNKMVTNVTKSKKLNLGQDIGVAYRSVRQQTMSILNLLLSVIAAFMFGYVASQYAFQDNLGYRVILGLFLAIIVAIADLYFMARTEI